MPSLLRFLAFVVVVAFAVAGVVWWVTRTAHDAIGPAHSRASDPVVLSALDNEITGLVARVVPSIVSISAKEESLAIERMRQIRKVFGMPMPAEPAPQLGSGVIVSPKGHILTNLHVVAGANVVDVHFNDGRVLPAALLGADQRVDIAVLKVDAQGLTPLPFANSDAIRAGQMVFAIGNPLGLQESVTQGIISGLGRRAIAGLSTEFFQTDAAINPGNSGSPLVDVRGEVVGINNLTAREGQGISFAIPANLAWRVYEDIINRGEVSRPWLGAVAYRLSAERAAAFGLPAAECSVVMSVVDGSSAQRAGMQQGDVLLRINGKPIRDGDDIRNRVSELKVGDTASVQVLRDGQTLDLRMRVEQMPR